MFSCWGHGMPDLADFPANAKQLSRRVLLHCAPCSGIWQQLLWQFQRWPVVDAIRGLQERLVQRPHQCLRCGSACTNARASSCGFGRAESLAKPDSFTQVRPVSASVWKPGWPRLGPDPADPCGRTSAVRRYRAAWVRARPVVQAAPGPAPTAPSHAASAEGVQCRGTLGGRVVPRSERHQPRLGSAAPATRRARRRCAPRSRPCSGLGLMPVRLERLSHIGDLLPRPAAVNHLVGRGGPAHRHIVEK